MKMKWGMYIIHLYPVSLFGWPRLDDSFRENLIFLAKGLGLKYRVEINHVLGFE